MHSNKIAFTWDVHTYFDPDTEASHCRWEIHFSGVTVYSVPTNLCVSISHEVTDCCPDFGLEGMTGYTHELSPSMSGAL
jgi:hypothetical protein